MQEEGKSVEEGDNGCRRQHGGLFMVVENRGRIPSSQAEEVAFHNASFWRVFLQQFLKPKNWALLGTNVYAIYLTSFQFSPKLAIFQEFEKKFSKVTGMIYINCKLPKHIMKYMVLDHFWAEKCHNFSKNWFFSKINIFGYFGGFWGEIQIRNQALRHIWPQ